METIGQRAENWLSKNAAFLLLAFIGVAVTAALIAVGVYAWVFRAVPVATQADVWGQLGDYFGGILNPIFGFLSLLALLAALVLQSKELRDSSEELKNSTKALATQTSAIDLQRFEQTFFAWLESYKDAVGSFVFETHSGVKAMREQYTLYSMTELGFRGLNCVRSSGPAIFTEERELLLAHLNSRPEIEVPVGLKVRFGRYMVVCWERTYAAQEFQLDAIFRVLYRLILWIDSQESTRLNNAQKWFYVSILRAHLTWIEMAYLYYNCLTPRGAKLRHLVDKFALFDNLNMEADLALDMVQAWAASEGWGYEAAAFNSATARAQLGLPVDSSEALGLASKGAAPHS